MGQLRRRGQVWWIRYYRNGKRFEESSRSERKQDAIDILRIREGDVAKGLPVSSKLARLTFDEAAADVIADYRVNGKRSADEVERRITKHLVPYFGGRRKRRGRSARSCFTDWPPLVAAVKSIRTRLSR